MCLCSVGVFGLRILVKHLLENLLFSGHTSIKQKMAAFQCVMETENAERSVSPGKQEEGVRRIQSGQFISVNQLVFY